MGAPLGARGSDEKNSYSSESHESSGSSHLDGLVKEAACPTKDVLAL